MTTLPPRERPARLAVGAIGAGRVGATLAAALDRAGHHAVAVAAVSQASRRRAEALVPEAAVLPPDEVAGRADLLLLAVPDDVLGPLVSGLAVAGAVRPGTLVAHTSGAHGFHVLDPLTSTGALPMALHPVMTFTGTEVDLQRLAGACFGVTSPEPLRLGATAESRLGAVACLPILPMQRRQPDRHPDRHERHDSPDPVGAGAQ